MDLFKPRGAKSPRRPTDDQQQHGVVRNTPRYSRFGGLKNSAAIGSKNQMAVSDHGGGKKVI